MEATRRVVNFDVDLEQQQQQDPEAAEPSSASFSFPARSILKRASSAHDHQAIEQPRASISGGANGDFDPYLGLGAKAAPDLPLLLVFNLMESRRFRMFSTPLRTKLFYGSAIVGGLLLASCLVLCFVLVGFQFHEHPQLPVVKVNALSIVFATLMDLKPGVLLKQQQEGKGNYFAYKLNYNCELLMNVKNPNKHLDIHHDSIEVTTFYYGFALAVDRIDNVAHPRNSMIRPIFRTIAIGLPIPLNVGYTLAREVNDPLSSKTEMVAEIIFNSKISLLPGFKPLPFKWRCRCVITEKGAFYKGFNCQCLDAKWKPKENLKSYRLTSWPTDYSQIPDNPMFRLSDDYYDPNINYLAENMTRWVW